MEKRVRAYVLQTNPVGFRHTPELRNCPLCGQFRDRARHRLRERTGVKAEGMSFAHPFATGAVSRRGTAARGRSPKPNRPPQKAAHERSRSGGPLEGCGVRGSEKAPVPRCLQATRHWYRRADSNRYAFRHRILNPARLPVSPRRHGDLTT